MNLLSEARSSGQSDREAFTLDASKTYLDVSFSLVELGRVEQKAHPVVQETPAQNAPAKLLLLSTMVAERFRLKRSEEDPRIRISFIASVCSLDLLDCWYSMLQNAGDGRRVAQSQLV